MLNSLKSPLVAAALASFALAGCATDQQHQEHSHPELMQRIQAAEQAAAEAKAAAARAQARADEAAAMAQANNDKIDKAFKKSQQK